MRQILLGLMLAIVSAAGALAAEVSAPTVGSCQTPLLLDKQAIALKEAFNAAKGKVRLLFVVDPICPACLRGIDEMSQDVLTPNAGNAQLATFIVHLPVLGAKEKDTQRTCKLLKSNPANHFWDPQGKFGRTLSSGVELKDKKGKWVYAWDVWLMYGPDAEWTGNNPPKPTLLMHQLNALSEGSQYDFYDSEKFAAQVADALKRAGSPTKTEK
ncbi:MAG: hypothetical protein IPP88_13130 [Betaproteobacteria bacterium]|nr:hypothetical protein [Betaproteobacteria bacterium]